MMLYTMLEEETVICLISLLLLLDNQMIKVRNYQQIKTVNTSIKWRNTKERPIQVKRPTSDVPIFRQKNSDVQFRCLVDYQN